MARQQSCPILTAYFPLRTITFKKIAIIKCRQNFKHLRFETQRFYILSLSSDVLTQKVFLNYQLQIKCVFIIMHYLGEWLRKIMLLL